MAQYEDKTNNSSSEKEDTVQDMNEEAKQHEEETLQRSVDELSLEPVEAPSLPDDPTQEDQEIEKDNEALSQASPETSKKSSLKWFFGLLLLASLAGGAYYAQEQQWFGLFSSSSSPPEAQPSTRVPASLTSEPVPEATPPETSMLTQEPVEKTSPEVIATKTEDTTHLVIDELKQQVADQADQIILLTRQLKERDVQIEQALTAQQNTKQENILYLLYQMAELERQGSGNKAEMMASLKLLQANIVPSQEGIALRMAVEQDIQALESLPELDLNRVFQETKALESLLEKAPFLTALSPQDIVSVETSPQEVVSPALEGTWLDRTLVQLERLPVQAYEAIRSDLGELVVVESLANPQLSRLSVEKVYELRQETLRHLWIAQEALLKQQRHIWLSALEKIEQQLKTYYNQASSQSQEALAMVGRLKNTPIELVLPELSHTRQALEQFEHVRHLETKGE